MIPHGTPGGYTNHACRCDLCKAAWAAAKYELRHRHHDYIPHGTDGGYTNYMCRCEACRTANREHKRMYRARQEAKKNK